MEKADYEAPHTAGWAIRQQCPGSCTEGLLYSGMNGDTALLRRLHTHPTLPPPDPPTLVIKKTHSHAPRGTRTGAQAQARTHLLLSLHHTYKHTRARSRAKRWAGVRAVCWANVFSWRQREGRVLGSGRLTAGAAGLRLHLTESGLLLHHVPRIRSAHWRDGKASHPLAKSQISQLSWTHPGRPLSSVAWLKGIRSATGDGGPSVLQHLK